MKRCKTVEAYLESVDRFQAPLLRLREILQGTELVEEVKWGIPTYTHRGKLVVGLAAFKEHFCLWFHQGALLEDEAGHLINAQEGKTQAMRQWRMTSPKDIRVRAIRAYVKESIEHLDAGRQVKARRGRPVDVPPELRAALDKSAPSKRAFEALTPGRQREYAEYIAEAKREATKAKRLDKILPMIRAGGGLNDKYR